MGNVKETNLETFMVTYQTFVVNNPLACFVLDLEGNIVLLNEAAKTLTGYDTNLEKPVNFIAFLNEKYIETTIAYFNEVVDGKSLTFFSSLKHKNGNWIDINIRCTPLIIDEVVKGMIGFVMDNEGKADIEQACNWENILDRIDICLWSLDAKTRRTIQISAVCENIFGYSQREFLENPHLQNLIIHPDDKNYVLNQIKLLKGGKSLNLEYRIISKKGKHKWITDSIVPIFAEGSKEFLRVERVVTDISKWKKAEERLKYQAFYDPLTGLPNRRNLEGELLKHLKEAKRKQEMAAVFYIDVDRFKFINDSLGHRMGDKLLQIIAKRLKACLRPGGMVARQGGDEFVVLLKNVTTEHTLMQIAAKMNRALAQPIKLLEDEYILSASIGISIFPDHAEDAEGLVMRADQAMYRAKESGTGIQLYQLGMTQSLSRKMLIEQYLHKAIENNELYLVYQPIVDVYTQKIVGLESLLRWNHPELGEISPVEFIKIAEESDLILKISNWVLFTACQHRRQWEDDKLAPFYISINVPGRQIQRSGFIQTIKDALSTYHLPPELLKIEITERTAMTNVDQTLNILKELQDYGVDIFLDDFGIGYSSLSYLVQYPFNTIKIDKSFIQGLTMKNQKSICKALVVLGRNLGMNVIAEGVEEVEQYHYLCSIGCNRMQGYYFSKPVSFESVESLFS